MKDQRKDYPLAYLITFSCYGSHLPGDERGWVDRRRNQYGEPFGRAEPALQTCCRKRMRFPPYQLEPRSRRIVRDAIIDACQKQTWDLRALHVRFLHVHSVIQADADPDVILERLKGLATRRLNASRYDGRVGKHWSRGGSKKWLWTEEQMAAAIEYVTEGQGEPMEVYIPPTVPPSSVPRAK